MNSEDRIVKITKVLTENPNQGFTPKEMAGKYLEQPNYSDVNTTRAILRMMYHFGFVSATETSFAKGSVPVCSYQLIKPITLREGLCEPKNN